MSKMTDGIIDAADLLAAIHEIRRGQRPHIMKRLWATEPRLAAFMEAAAEHMAGTVKQHASVNFAAVRDELLDFIVTIVRSIELAHHRLWRDLPPSSPLARLLNGTSSGGSSRRKK